MALQLSKPSHFGFTISEAYARIAHIQNTKDNGVATVEFYFNADTRNAGNPPIQTEEIVVSIAGGASIADAYVFLKTLDQFATATDV